MNNKTQLKTVAIAVMIAISSLGVSTVQAEDGPFMPYGSVGEEDQALVFKDGFYYLNVVPAGTGMFMKLTDIDQDYSIDAAIERFHISEDTTHFNVQPSVFSSTELVYQLDEDNQFQMIGIVQ